MDLIKTFEIYDPLSMVLKMPKDTVLSQTQLKSMESALETARSLYQSLEGYFERQAKPMDKRASHLDESLRIRATFLNFMLLRFDKVRQEKLNKEIEERAKSTQQAMRDIERQQQLGVNDLFSVYGR